MLHAVKLEFLTLRHPVQKDWKHSFWSAHSDCSLFNSVPCSLVCISYGQPDATSHWSLLTGNPWTHWYSYPKLLEPAFRVRSESLLQHITQEAASPTDLSFFIYRGETQTSECVPNRKQSTDQQTYILLFVGDTGHAPASILLETPFPPCSL